MKKTYLRKFHEDQRTLKFKCSTPRHTCSPLFWDILPKYKTLPAHLCSLDSHLSRRAFLLARVNSFISSVSWGRYNQIPAAERYCFHGCEVPDTLTHIILGAFSVQRAAIQNYLTDLDSKCSCKALIIKSMLSEQDPTNLAKLADVLASMLEVNSLCFSLRKHSCVKSISVI